MNDDTTIHTVDNCPLQPGVTVYLVRQPELSRYREENKIVEPMACTVVRVTDGEYRSALLRLEDGSETRWYPKRGHIETEALFAKIGNAYAECRSRNNRAAADCAQQLNKEYKALKDFRAAAARLGKAVKS